MVNGIGIEGVNLGLREPWLHEPSVWQLWPRSLSRVAGCLILSCAFAADTSAELLIAAPDIVRFQLPDAAESGGRG